MFPIIRRKANLASEIAVPIEAKHTVFDPSRVAPVNGCARTAGCLAAAAVFGAVGLTGAGLEDPGVCHGYEGDEGSDSSIVDLHFEDFEKSQRREDVVSDEDRERLSELIELCSKKMALRIVNGIVFYTSHRCVLGQCCEF